MLLGSPIVEQMFSEVEVSEDSLKWHTEKRQQYAGVFASCFFSLSPKQDRQQSQC